MTLRIGCVPYLNARPLVDYFDGPESPQGCELITAPPSQLALMLRAGFLDVANVSTFEALRLPGLRIVPGISVSADGPVKSVRLFHRRPLPDLETVALDSSSLTSAALIRLLLSDMYGCNPAYRSAEPDLPRMLAAHDAALLIGDLQLFHNLSGVGVFDLGAGWKQMTGLPFVYALWLAREEAATSGLTTLLQASRDWGCTHLDAIADRWSCRLGLPPEQVHDYFDHVMHYGLGPERAAAILEYQQRLHRAGLIARCDPLKFAPEAASVPGVAATAR
ncbi:MAG: menaquinone biosynthesis protein [Armatimonadetes bacterium]|nr:menaquinone biosynthesis protein [Armatimonadota bacterium]MDE2207929.1 menaquinone biosynthesis protein [Armatimonadota bacterium]